MWHCFRFPLSPVFVAALLVLCGLLAVPGRCLAGPPSQQYLAARRNYPPRPGLTLERAAQNPDAYRGMTLEITGQLIGMARTSEGASLMLSTERNGTINLSMSLLPHWVQPGSYLRALVVVAGAPQAGMTIGLPDLLVVAVASASDVAVLERREQSARQTARTSPQSRSFPKASGPLPRRAAASAASPPGTSRPWLDARTAQLSRSLSSDARAVYEPYRAYIRGSNRRLSERDVDAITTSILLFSERFDVDPRLVIALILAESSFRPEVTSHKGAMGLGQLMPEEARKLGLSNPYDPVQNIAGAVYLLKGRLDKYSGGVSKQDLKMRHIILALASYNAGMGAVKRYGGVPPYRETRNYVKKVEKIYRELCGGDAS